MKTVSKKLLSLMLAAILLVSAVPFQALALSHDPSLHVLSEIKTNGAGTHWQECTTADCDDAAAHTRFNETACTYSNGACVTCGAACPHTTQNVVNQSAATCISAGYSGDLTCSACGAVITAGAAVPATGVHTYVNHICSVCGAVEVGAAALLTLDANGGTVNGGASMTVNVNIGSAISVMPDAIRQGYQFAGWYTDSNIQVYPGLAYDGTYLKVTAKWTQQTELLTVRRILNGDPSTAKTLQTYNVPVGTPLLSFLNNNVTTVIQQELAMTPGFSWQYNFWKDYSGSQPLTSQADCMNQAQTVFVNFVSNPYTLYFNANGGVVTPTSKSVYFGSKVGTLPIPSLSGKVFQGWKDVNGVTYTADTVYNVAGDSSLTAVWQDEALVILYIYINGDFSSCNRMVAMDGFVKNNNISRSDVLAQVAKYYTPASGVLNIAGLFDEYSWSSYRSNTSKAGVENIQISNSHPNKIFVMVNNASTGSTVVTGSTTTTTTTTMVNGPVQGTSTPLGSYWVSNGNGTGYWVYPANVSVSNPTNPTYIYIGTNPKTGDTAMLEVAAAVMVLAAGVLVTLMTLRKKKMI